jgi:ATP-dependent DNA ligase
VITIGPSASARLLMTLGIPLRILDGEVVVDGSTDFSVLQNELKGQSTKIVLVAFDLLYLNGHDLRKLPLVERKAELKKIIQHTDIQSDSFDVDGAEVSLMPAKSGSRAWFPRFEIAVTCPAAATIG